MTKWALTVLLVLTAPIAFLGLVIAGNVVVALADGRWAGDFFSPHIPVNSVPLALAPIWIAAAAWTVRLFRPGPAPSKTGRTVSRLFVLAMSVGVLFAAAWAIVVYLWATTM